MLKTIQSASKRSDLKRNIAPVESRQQNGFPSVQGPVDPLLLMQRIVGNRAIQRYFDSGSMRLDQRHTWVSDLEPLIDSKASVRRLIRRGWAQHGIAYRNLQRQPQPPPVPVAQQEWQNFPRIRARYSTWQTYQTVRNRVAGWNNPQIGNPGPFIDAAIREWNNNQGVRHHFNGGFDGNPTGSYLNIRRLFQQRNIPNPARYIRNNIVPIRFFNIRTPGHRDLRRALNSAQAVLRAAGQNFVFRTGWSFVPRTIRGGGINSLSNHALGRAIDFNWAGNPLITNAQQIMVINAVIRPIMPQGLLPTTNPALLRLASIYFQQNYNAAWIAGQRNRLQALNQSRQQLRQQIRQSQRQIRQHRRRIQQLRRQLRRAAGQPRQQQLRAEMQRRQQIITVFRGLLNINRTLHRFVQAVARRQRTLVRAIRRHRRRLSQYARRGFMNLPTILVVALQQAGLTWGGAWGTRKDFMHFELP